MTVHVKLRAYGDDRDRDMLRFFELDGIRLGIRSRWCAYDSTWRLFFHDTDATQFAGPVDLVPGINLLQQYQYDARIPPGQMYVWSNDRSAPTFAGMDETYKVIYRPLSEVT